MDALKALAKVAEPSGLPKSLAELLHVRASQINGCAVCLDMHTRAMQMAAGRVASRTRDVRRDQNCQAKPTTPPPRAGTT